MIRRRAILTEGNISEIGYDPELCLLSVVFRDVQEYVYTYENISAAQFAALFNAESTGQHFAKAIRPAKKDHPFTKSLNANRPRSVGTVAESRSIINPKK